MTDANTTAGVTACPHWTSASLAAAVLAVAPTQLGGAVLRAGFGPVRDRWLHDLQTMMVPDTPWRHMPVNISEDRLLGGLDLCATLSRGHIVAEQGLLASAHGGVLVLPMAERITPHTMAQLTMTLDTQRLRLERDGLSQTMPAAFAVLALDEGASADEHVSAALLERVAFYLPLDGVSLRDCVAPCCTRAQIDSARQRWQSVHCDAQVLSVLCHTALALGVLSLRAPLMALRVARIHAALMGRDAVLEEDVTMAGAWVLAPRATQLPRSDAEQGETQAQHQDAHQEAPQDKKQDHQQAPPASTSESKRTNSKSGNTDTAQPDPADSASSKLQDAVIAASKAAIPAQLLALIGHAPSRQAAGSVGKQGAWVAAQRGRPIGVKRSDLRGGRRLNVLATLRTAAPWQRLRRTVNDSRVRVWPEDFQITRFRHHTQTTSIFVLDASGSSALHRLAEAKGAIELLLAECYVRRDQVAVVAFRQQQAQLLLPPTRSLVRAKRGLASLPGGGGTPLAAGLDAGLAVAMAEQRRGSTPLMIVLTDGRANVTRAGVGAREQAQNESLQAARLIHSHGIRTLMIDTSPRPQALGQQLAAACGGRYWPLPYADASALVGAVRSAMPIS